MPQRFLRPGIRTSERWNSISRDAQALYIAILTLVDDYGRYDGRPSVLCGDAFSVWNDRNPKKRINPQETAALCCELQSAHLIHFYQAESKQCLQIIQWEERIREGAKEKWPKANEIDIPQDSAAERSVPLPPSSPPSSPSSSSPYVCYTPESRAILFFLNEKSGKHFRECEKSLKPIHDRLSEDGVDIEGVKQMIDRQCLLWGGTSMQEYLRPETLFNQTKFNSYYASKDMPVNHENNKSNSPQHIDRSIGTTNEGVAKEYEGLGRLVKNEPAR